MCHSTGLGNARTSASAFSKQTNRLYIFFFPFVIQQRGVQRFVRGIQLDSVDRWRGNAGDMDAPSPAKTGGRQLLLRGKRRRRGKMRIEALSVFKWYIVCTTNDCAGVGAGGESWAAAGEGLDEDSAKGRSRGSMGMNNNFGRSKYIYASRVLPPSSCGGRLAPTAYENH